MRLSTHNGLETWVEWRPSRSPFDRVPWTRIEEVPIRLATGGEYQKATSSLGIDSDQLSQCESKLQYRVAVTQSNYTDWREDLKVVLSFDGISTTGYLLPEHTGQTTYVELQEWSSLSQGQEALGGTTLATNPTLDLEDELATLEPPPIEKEGLVDEASLAALLGSLDELADGDQQVSRQPACEHALAVRSKALSSTDGVTTASGRKESAPHIIQAVPAIARTCIEVAIYRGQYYQVPTTPPPAYSEKELPVRLYYGTSFLAFAAEHEQWIGTDMDTPWCRFVYQPKPAQRMAPTIEPEILSDETCKQLRIQLDEYAKDLVAQAERDKRQKRHAERRKIKEMERERVAEFQRQRQAEIEIEEAAMAQRQARSDASKKAWAKRRETEGRTMATKVPAIKRLQQEEYATAGPSRRNLDLGIPRFGERIDSPPQHRSGRSDSHHSGVHQSWSRQAADRKSRHESVKYCRGSGSTDSTQPTMDRRRVGGSTHGYKRESHPSPMPASVMAQAQAQMRRSTPFITDSGCLIPATPSPEPERKPRVKSEHSDIHRRPRHDGRGPRISHEALARARASRLASKRTDGPRHSILPRLRESIQPRRRQGSEDEAESDDLSSMARQREAYRERERERDRKKVKREDKVNERMARGMVERAKVKESTMEGGYRDSTLLLQREKYRDKSAKAAEVRADRERKRGVKLEPKGSEVINLTQLSD